MQVKSEVFIKKNHKESEFIHKRDDFVIALDLRFTVSIHICVE